MGVLDELKCEARQRREAAARQSQDAQVRSEAQQRRLDACMRRLYEYFTEFCEHLRVVDPDIVVDYALHQCGRLTGLRQGGYKVAADRPDSLDRFTFHYTCAADVRCETRFASHEVAAPAKHYLSRNNLRYKLRDAGNGATVLTVEGFVPVGLDFSADVGRGIVRLTLRNLAEIGTIGYSLSPDLIEPGLMDELAKAVMRKPHRLAELTGDAVSDAARKRLRVVLAKEQRRRERELRGPLWGLLGRFARR